MWKFHATPAATAYSDIRQAVAIDCEMGTAESGDNELIRVTLIDYFSSAVLVDSLVYPDVAMSHYNTCFSGVTKKDMEMASARGRCFRGRDQARTAVWRFVGPNTIVVGHSAHNDLNAMRWIHSVVVDTWLIESTNAKTAKAKAERELKEAQPPNAEQELEEAQPPNVSIDTSATPNKSQQISRKGPKGSGALSLKTLAMVRLKREIQAAGKKGHDSLEDALAARDLAHWNVGNNNSAAAGR